MSNSDKNLTSALILRRISMLGENLGKQMEDMEERLIKRFDRVDKRFDEIEKRLEHLEQDVFILVVRTKAMHEQLQTIEKEKLPKIRKSVRKMQKRLKEQEVVAAPALAKA